MSRGRRGGILFPFVFLQTCSPFAKAEEVEFLHGPLNDQPSSSLCIIKTLSRLGIVWIFEPSNNTALESYALLCKGDITTINFG